MPRSFLPAAKAEVVDVIDPQLILCRKLGTWTERMAAIGAGLMPPPLAIELAGECAEIADECALDLKPDADDGQPGPRAHDSGYGAVVTAHTWTDVVPRMLSWVTSRRPVVATAGRRQLKRMGEIADWWAAQRRAEH